MMKPLNNGFLTKNALNYLHYSKIKIVLLDASTLIQQKLVTK